MRDWSLIWAAISAIAGVISAIFTVVGSIVVLRARRGQHSTMSVPPHPRNVGPHVFWGAITAAFIVVIVTFLTVPPDSDCSGSMPAFSQNRTEMAKRLRQ
jgi:heme/copper-type cytochrome/quinol oxidase subunit 2